MQRVLDLLQVVRRHARLESYLVRVGGRQNSCIAQFVRVFPLAQSSLRLRVSGQRLLGAHLCSDVHRAHLLVSLVGGLRNSPEDQVLVVLAPGAVEQAGGVPGGRVLHGGGGDGEQRRSPRIVLETVLVHVWIRPRSD